MTINYPIVNPDEDILSADFNALRKDVIRNAGDYGVTGGSANAQTLTIDSSIGLADIVDGFKVRFKAGFTTTSSTPTLDVNGTGALVMTNRDGQPLTFENIKAGGIYEATKDGSNWKVQNILEYARIVEIFQSDGTWNKPFGIEFVAVECVGAGGGGAGSISSSGGFYRGSGGGGGAKTPLKIFRASDLPSSVPVTVGQGGIGSNGYTGSSPGIILAGNGGDSSFGVYLTAYGGAGGMNTNTNSRRGGTGGGTGGAGVQSTTAGSSAVRGGYPIGYLGNAGGGGGGGYDGGVEVGNAEFGGGMGDNNFTSSGGGSSIYGAGGGGGGGLGTDGGASGSYTNGGGGTGGGNTTSGNAIDGGDGISRIGEGAGDGGGGGGVRTGTGTGGVGGVGGNGGTPGGGGGAGGGWNTTQQTATKKGGDGGDGIVRVFCW